MKKFLILFLFALFSFNTAFSKEIAFINMDEVAKGSNALKKANEQLQKEKSELETLFKKKEEELKKEKEDLESKAAIYTKEVLQQKAIDFQKKVIAFQESVKQKEGELQNKLTKCLLVLNDKVIEIINKAMTEEQFSSKYSSVAITSAFIYYNKNDEITLEILKRLNKEKLDLLKLSEQQNKRLK